MVNREKLEELKKIGRVGHYSHPINLVGGLIELIEENMPFEKVMEIGSFSGISTEVWLCFGCKVWTVDNNYQGDYYKLEKKYPDRLISHKMKSHEAAKLFEDGFFDLVYIDAGHAYHEVKLDIESWKSKVKSRGLLTGHDYSNNDPGVIKAVDELLGGPDKVFSDSSWIKKM